jgi:hypothetical protein
VSAKEEDIITPLEGVLGPITVMHIPVDNEDPLAAEVGPRMLSGDRDVVKEAEAHRAATLRVMPRRPNEGHCRAMIARHRRSGSTNRRPSR